MKKIWNAYLVVGLFFLSSDYAFAEQEKAVKGDTIEMVSIKAELSRYSKTSSSPGRKGDKRTILKTNEAYFWIVEPSKYAGREIIINSFDEEEADSRWRFKSKEGAYYSFDIPNGFFLGGYKTIHRSAVQNFKEI